MSEKGHIFIVEKKVALVQKTHPTALEFLVCLVMVTSVIMGIRRYQCPHDEASAVLGDYQTQLWLANAGQVKLGQVKLGQVKLGQVKLGQVVNVEKFWLIAFSKLVPRRSICCCSCKTHFALVNNELQHRQRHSSRASLHFRS